jgi:glucosamine--fructose-6-phosphate aminotransferase (isomerizing)
MKSETDTEIFLNIIVLEYIKLKDSNLIDDENRIKKAVLQAVQKVEGTFGIVLQNIHHPDKLFCIRKGSPLLIGTDKKQNTLIICSEKQAFPSFIDKYIRLESDELVVCKFNNHTLSREFCSGYSLLHLEESLLHDFSYFTEKEIYDQKNLVQKVTKFGSRLKKDRVKLGGLDSSKEALINIDHIYFFGCGTSYHSSLLLQYLFLELGEFDTVLAFDASEFETIYLPKTSNKQCGIFISQSGETRDLLKIHKEFSHNHFTLGITNVVDSFLSTVTDAGLYTNIGKEKGVASTKSFTAQIISGILILIWFLQLRRSNHPLLSKISISLFSMDPLLDTFIPAIFSYCQEHIVPKIYSFDKMFLMGRKKDYFIAKEGALKIKEISYRCAEAYSTASLKHGPFALLDPNYLVIFILSDDSDDNVKKVMNNVQEVHARGAMILLITTQKVADSYQEIMSIIIPSHFFGFLFASIVLQIVAYQLSIQSGINPDFPRNLAKVVTVE